MFRIVVQLLFVSLGSTCALAEQVSVRSTKSDRQSAIIFPAPRDMAIRSAAPALLPTEAIVIQLAGEEYSTLADVPPVSDRSPLAADLTINDRLERLFMSRDATDVRGYDEKRLVEQSMSVRWDLAAVVGGISIFGIAKWNWGSSDFNFNNEGWFGEDTGSLGMDKLGHAFTTYLLTEYLTQRILQESVDPRGAAFTAAGLAMGVFTYVEILDGFSGDHGFSTEDLIADAAGAAFSILRSTVPGLSEKLDFRIEYIPSGNDKISPVSDYSGQKYLMVLKLAGFEPIADTPLRFIELQAGYYARGFTDEERKDGDELRREPYVAIGFNLQELFANQDSVVALMAQRGLEYVQVPYTYVATTQQ
jgi:hypothetical protein